MYSYHWRVISNVLIAVYKIKWQISTTWSWCYVKEISSVFEILPSLRTFNYGLSLFCCLDIILSSDLRHTSNLLYVCTYLYIIGFIKLKTIL